MREDLDKRMKLGDRFAKMIALGLWSDSIAQPDGQVLERIQRLNDDIEAQIKELYIPENQIDNKIKRIKETLYNESRQKKGIQHTKETSTWFASRRRHLRLVE